MGIENIIKQYLRTLKSGNYEAIVKLFTKDAVVYSPIYGRRNVKTFFKEVFADTVKSKLTLFNIFKGKNSAAFHFNYEWTLKNGTVVSSETIDIIKISKGKIKELKIIYDASKTRKALKR